MHKLSACTFGIMDTALVVLILEENGFDLTKIDFIQFSVNKVIYKILNFVRVLTCVKKQAR